MSARKNFNNFLAWGTWLNSKALCELCCTYMTIGYSCHGNFQI